MSRWSRLIPIMAVSVLLAACGQGKGDTPFSPSTPASPRLDGSGLLVGGNATSPTSGSDGTSTDGTGDTTTQSDAGTVPQDTTSRGGGLLVGGN